MKRNLMELGMGVVAVALMSSGCNTQDPERQCSVARASSDGSLGSFAATYTLKEGQDPEAVCAQLESGAVGLQKYFNRDPNAPDSVAIRTERMNELLELYSSRQDPDSSHEPYALGSLASELPGADNFCTVPELAPARLEVPASGADPAQSFAYEWSNLRIYNTPEIPGTQFVADLRYTENGCTAEYQVKGIWPVVGCATGSRPNDDLCDPYPNPEQGRLRGSGINPLFPVKCDPVALICVLTGDVPSPSKP
ncbi:hypothetical protein [Hyalangium rubrum]|uniref:MlpA protein n=1 Tax=Hyalangium rubrum TaxID=3103134 RepID=A0ABU5HFI2_9BACT|nr:hypothetical protein [Hyalangium sp. s54d21]MDY7231567.1 hypothetical protein [Hyalangium sp. s54d21]